MKKFFQKILFLPRLPFVAAIWVYQHTLSPDHGPFRKMFPHGYCRFYPSCSEYGMQAYKKHGATKGTILTTYRIARCNPWNPGGNDTVPEKNNILQYLRSKHLLS